MIDNGSFERAMSTGRAMLNYTYRGYYLTEEYRQRSSAGGYGGISTPGNPEIPETMLERMEQVRARVAAGWRPDPCVCGTERVNGYCGHCRG